MTAIFLVWNRSGFAVAADQSVSTQGFDAEGKPTTLWTESGSKLFSFEGHKVVVATSENLLVNSIPVSSILNRWNRELTTEFDTLAQYVHNFLDWLGQQKLNEHYAQGYSTDRRIFKVLNSLKLNLESNEDFEDSTTEEKIRIINATFDSWENEEHPNLFAYGLENYRDLVAQKYPDETFTDMQTSLFLRERSKRELSQVKTIEELEFLKELFDIKFDVVFQYPFNENLLWQKTLCDRLLSYISNFIDNDEDSGATLLFTGYGKEEWIPQCVSIKIFHYDTPLPKVSLLEISNPEQTWYQSIAQDDELNAFLVGISDEYRTEILGLVETDSWEIQTDDEATVNFEEFIDNLSIKRLRKMRSKINLLSLDKLEFIARQFVQVESLASFLIENLPSVGGNIDSITMNR